MKKAKRIISILICAALLLPAAVFPASAADAAPLKALISSAAQLLYTDGTSASRRQLKAAYDTAVSVAAQESPLALDLNAAYDLLSAAIERFVPVASPERVEIAGFAAWDAETVSSFTDTSGCAIFFDETGASVPSVKVVTAGKETAYFSNAASDEAVHGGNIFSEDITETAGLRFSLQFNDPALVEKLSVSVGVRAEGATRTYTVIDIPAGNGCVAIDWEFFTADYDAVGTGVDLADLNYIAFCFEGVKPGFIGRVSDLHCFNEDILSTESTEYQEVKATAITSGKYYKIVDSTTGLALSVSPAVTDTETMTSTGYENRVVNKQTGLALTMEERADSARQEWQIYRLPDGNCRIINRDSSLALYYEYYVLYFTVGINVVDLNESKQDWKVNRSSNGFKIYGASASNAYLNYTSGSLRASKSQQIWDVYECVRGDWKQVWSDEFEGDSVDRSKWTVYDTKNRGETEPIFFRDNERNVFVGDGELVIRSIKENYNGYPMTGAYLTTEGHYYVSYGKVEMRAKLPVGNWIWPALWMMGIEGNWPQNGEIDIMELVGGGEEDSKLYGTLHWLSDYADRSKEFVKGVEIYNRNKVSLGDNYHTYGLEWDHDQLRIYFDGMQYVSMNLTTDAMRWGYGDNPHYIILNTSCRGPGNNEIYEETAAESEFNIDYVRVSKRTGDSSEAAETITSEAITGEKIVSTLDEVHGGTKVAASPDGSYFSVADRHGNIFQHNVKTGAKTYVDVSGAGPVMALKYSPSGKYLAVGSRLSSMLVYKSADLSNRSYMAVNGVCFEALEFSADESLIIAGGRNDNEASGAGDNKNLYVFTTSAGILRNTVNLGSDVRAISASDDGGYVAAGTSSGKVYVLNASSFEVLGSCDMGAAVRGVAFVPDSDNFVAADEAGNILLFNAETRETVMRIDNPDGASIASIDVSRDGSRLVASSSDNNARLFDLGSGRLVALLDGFDQMTTAAKFSLDCNRIAVCSLDGTVRIYDECGGLLHVFKVTAGSGKGTSLADVAISGDGTAVLAVPIQHNESVYYWNIQPMTDKTPLYRAINNAAGVDHSEYTAESLAVLREALEASNALLRSKAASAAQIAESVRMINTAINHLVMLPGAEIKLNGFEGWASADVSSMTATSCKLSLTTSSVSITPNVTQSLCINANSTATWKMYNTDDGEIAGQNPFGADLSNCDGISIWAKGLTKEQSNGKIFIGYTGETGSFLFSAALPKITLEGQYIQIPFSSFEYVSGEETLDLTKLNTIGFSGKGAKGMFAFTELTAYTEPGSVPVVSGIEDGATYDITDTDAPSASWDSGMAFLDGNVYEAGTPIVEAGAHVLSVNNHGTETTVAFTVVDNTPEPVISGVYERQVFDIAAEESALPTWDVGTATLNGEAYSGDAVARVGEYTLTVTNKHKTASVFFIIINTSENQQIVKKGDFDKDGKISVSDALSALRIAAKLAPETPEAVEIGDIDGDGKVSVGDALSILRVAARLANEDTL